MSTPSGSIRNFIPMQNKYDRVVLLVDMDCFYCQVEEKLNPELKGQPIAVVQYNAWRGGGIIAVNYAARAKGVTRHMRGDEAREQCPEIQLVQVPNVREKADLSKYRDAGKDVANVLQRFTTLLERASVDEAYLDITDAVNKRLAEMNAGTFVLQPQELINTYAVGYERIGDYLKVITTHFSNPYADDDYLNSVYDSADVPAVRQSDVRLLLGASIASEIRAAVKEITSFECSAGIAHNKILAKLACGMNKPNKQTILPLAQVGILFETLPVGKIKGLGGKFGEEVSERLKIRSLGQMLKFTEHELQKMFDEKNGSWLYNICRGIDLEAVTPRFYSKSIGCCKKFPGRNNITGLNTLKHWLKELATEISDRLEKDIAENNRKAKQMTVSYIQELDNEEVSSSRSVPLVGFDQEALTQRSLEVIKANTKQFLRPGSEGVLNNPIKFLGISVGKFETISSNQSKLQEMFANQVQMAKKRKSENETKEEEEVSETPSRVEEKRKESPTTSTKQKQSDEKMKSFFAKYLQSEPKPKNKVPKSDESPKSTSKDAKPGMQSKIEVSDQPKSSEQRSFFAAALFKQNTDTLQSASKVDERASSPTSYDVPSIENDDILRLEAELTAIDDEQIRSPDGSPQRKKPKTTTTAASQPSEGIASTEIAQPPQPSYENQYAEYAIPEICLDQLEFQRCDICGVKVPVEERALQTHRDHHYAQQLSQQQREEFRAEKKSKASQNIQPNKSKGKGSSTEKKPTKASTSTVPSITKFLKSKSTTPAHSTSENFLQSQPSTSAAAAAAAATQEQTPSHDEPMLLCSHCNQSIKCSEFAEHTDYHIAKQLQRELNKLEVRTVVIPKSKTSSSSNKALNKSISSGSSQASASKKPITQFFSQMQT